MESVSDHSSATSIESPIHRCPGEGLKATIDWLTSLLDIDRQQAYHLYLDSCFRIGTDRHFYIDVEHARRRLSQPQS
jgi:hypothetical protein